MGERGIAYKLYVRKQEDIFSLKISALEEAAQADIHLIKAATNCIYVCTTVCLNFQLIDPLRASFVINGFTAAHREAYTRRIEY